MSNDAKLNDKDLALVFAMILAAFILGLAGGHYIGYDSGFQEAQQDDQPGYVTCSTINGSGTMCFTSGDVEFEWMHNATSTTRNGTMNLQTLNQSNGNWTRITCCEWEGTYRSESQ